MAKNIAVSLFLLGILAVAKDGRAESEYLGEILCKDNSRDAGCEPTKECTVTCPSRCNMPFEGTLPRIYGTRNYTDDSSVCSAAVHDYRIRPGSSGTNVTFVRNDRLSIKYVASIQQMIHSFARGGNYTRQFYFSTPYFTEDIFDVATLNFNYLYPENGTFIQLCHINGNETIQDFRYYTPKSARINTSLSSEGWHEVTWRDPDLQPGGYWCNIVNRSYSNVMSLAVSSEAHFIPEQLTVTKSIGENVLIKFTARRNFMSKFIKTAWNKDGWKLDSFSNMRLRQNNSEYFLEIDNLEVGDAGIYSLQFHKEDDVFENTEYYSEEREFIKKRGVMRLIVRRCRKNYFGPECNQKCPNCLNGGVCHDIMGNCICPPGFNGTYCENNCQTGYFGQSCSQRCASSQYATNNSCRGALICQPDPYGCSCAAGYIGIACDQHVEMTPATTTWPATRVPLTNTTSTTLPTTTDTRNNTSLTTTGPNVAMSSQKRICQSVFNGSNAKVVLIPGNSCRYRCLDARGNLITVLKTGGEPCNQGGICVTGVCQNALHNSGCPENFTGVLKSESICTVECYSDHYAGVIAMLKVKEGDNCTDKEYNGTCFSGKCVNIEERQE